MRKTIMMLTAAGSIAAPVCAAAQVPAACLKGPSAEEVARIAAFYPAQAKAADKEGVAVLLCGRSPHARLVDCQVQAEEPVGFGFGEAALKLAGETRDNPLVRMSPAAAQPRSVAFRFTLAAPFVTPNVFSENWGQMTVIQRADWLEKPSASDMGAAYPRRLFGGNPPGKALLRCAIGLAGDADCTVLEESPAQRGFGEAALKLSKSFRFRPMLVDGQPCGGSETVIPITFNPPD